MKRKHNLLPSVILAMMLLTLAASCRKGCTCYAYNGDVLAYYEADLEALGYDCNELEKVNGGGLYSICDNSF